MKPLKLTMSAFGTFAQKTVIDFEEISRDGVFLITGSNGSGKTTIFDAISFALYGETCNAKRRGKKEMHSDFVSIQEKSAVNLKFLHQDQIFLVKRILSFSESGKNPTTKAFLYLKQLNNYCLIEEGTTRVNSKIQEMLRITQGEFNQTVMIAQGEFQQIVNADTKTRMSLFRKLFDTKIYSDFEAKLQEHYNILKDQSDSCQGKITAALDSLQFRPDFQPDVPKNAVCADMYLNALQQQNLYDQKVIADLEIRKKICRDEQESLIRNLTQAEQNNQKLQELSRYQQTLQELQTHAPDMQNQQTQIRKAQDALQISGIEKILLQTERNLSLQKQNQNALQSSLLSQETAFREAEKNLMTANQNAEEIPALIQREFELNQTLPKYQELREAESNEQKYSALVKQLSFQYETESRNYTRIFQDFCLGQAGLLAETLQPGMSCPVCGSQEHPAPAVRHQHTPSKNQLDKAQKSRDDAEKNLNQAAQTCAEYSSRLETLRKENPLLEQHSEQILLQELTVCRRKIQQLQQEQTSAQKAFNQTKSQCDRSAAQLQETKKQIAGLEQDLYGCEQDFQKALQDYQFQNPEDYQNAKLSSGEIRKLEQEIQNFQSRTQKLQALIEKLRKETAGMEFINTENLKIQKSQKDQLYSELESEYRNICLVHNANESTAQKLPAMIEDYHKIYQQLQDYEELYRTTSGTKGSGQAKFKLEAYVQQYYFRRVILQARQRLAILTNQKFDLRCRETAKNNISQSGLELEILDLATNQWRDVSTLSGGESFMLALSLALGLSDIIQERSSGIQIDAMFIDEGFGSLDETSLNQAVELLGKLADGKRLIGVISHVESLISRIDSKIYVTKKATGSEISFSW
ncbi:MAG: SMC family ATPase [Oscillospiraceae bacterium]|nr:SMC family ATPase [Oscillospiraceae bacterium]